jgi:hypothetical protein
MSRRKRSFELRGLGCRSGIRDNVRHVVLPIDPWASRRWQMTQSSFNTRYMEGEEKSYFLLSSHSVDSDSRNVNVRGLCANWLHTEPERHPKGGKLFAVKKKKKKEVKGRSITWLLAAWVSLVHRRNREPALTLADPRANHRLSEIPAVRSPCKRCLIIIGGS